MDFSTLAVFCEHRYFENGHENAMRTGGKTHFQWYLQGILHPIISKTLFFEKNCLDPQFSSSVANSWNKSLSTLFFLQTYWYAWLNNCGLGRPLMPVFTRPQMKPLHHVHSLSICCVPATLLCPRCFFPRILRVKLRATVLDLFKFQRPSKIFRGTFPAKTSICEALRVFFSNFGQQLACQNFTHTFYRRLCAAREQVSTELSRSKSDWCHVVTFPARECSTESIGWQPLSWMFHFLLFDQVLEGDRILSDPVFLNKVASIFTAALSFVRSNWKNVLVLFCN